MYDVLIKKILIQNFMNHTKYIKNNVKCDKLSVSDDKIMNKYEIIDDGYGYLFYTESNVIKKIIATYFKPGHLWGYGDIISSYKSVVLSILIHLTSPYMPVFYVNSCVVICETHFNQIKEIMKDKYAYVYLIKFDDNWYEPKSKRYKKIEYITDKKNINTDKLKYVKISIKDIFDVITVINYRDNYKLINSKKYKSM